jgi:transcriptional regulator with XRE-family HTH domain
VSRRPDPDDAAIGGRLRQARAEARITQAGAAAALGIPRSAVSELEAGTRRLAAAELARCAALYRRPAGWFLNGSPEAGGPLEALARLAAALPPADQETVTRFAEFLAARQAARP